MNNIITAINSSKKIGITYHASPDGDALGSALALHLGLKKLNIESYIISKDSVPSNLLFLPNIEIIDGTVTTIKENTDLLIVLDCGNVERISSDMNLNEITCDVINIDHHLSNDLYGDINFVDSQSASVGEIIYKLLNALKINLDNEISTCIYVSLITDTGSFKHSNTTNYTHNLAGELISTGIDFSEIHRSVFENQEFDRLKFYGKVLDKMTLKNNICVMEISKNMLNETTLDIKDLSDVIAMGSKVKESEVTVLFKEQDNFTKVSLRSKNRIDVSKIAEQFNGGGHKRAAGLRLDCSLHEAKVKVIKIIEDEMKLWME